MRLVVGLGNPGSAYRGHRHNVGFMALDRIAADHGFSPFRARFRGEIAEGQVEGQKVLALKPMTMMNLSGESVASAVRFHKLSPADVIVFHDELDLAPGKVRVKLGGGSSHNGIRDIDRVLGPDYWRVRIGVGHPGDPDRVTSYLLNDFSADERRWLAPLVTALSEAFPLLVAGDTSRFMTKVALLAPPPGNRPENGTE